MLTTNVLVLTPAPVTPLPTEIPVALSTTSTLVLERAVRKVDCVIAPASKVLVVSVVLKTLIHSYGLYLATDI